MTDAFEFNGITSWDMNMQIEKYPARGGAVRKFTAISVAGRNGDLHYAEDAFENYIQPYECYFHGAKPTAAMAHDIQSWLLGGTGYKRLEDSYDPEHFRLAAFTGPLNVADILGRYGRCTVEFNCDPRAFLKSGEFPIDFEDEQSGTLRNPTAFTALPLIYLYGSGAGTVSINDVTVEVHEITGSLILDCETQNAYYNGAPYYGMGDGPVENKNSSIYAPKFPALKPGNNTWQFAGDIDVLRIIPRWWEL